jgi:hypothetical protein
VPLENSAEALTWRFACDGSCGWDPREVPFALAYGTIPFTFSPAFADPIIGRNTYHPVDRKPTAPDGSNQPKSWFNAARK